MTNNYLKYPSKLTIFRAKSVMDQTSERTLMHEVRRNIPKVKISYRATP